MVKDVPVASDNLGAKVLSSVHSRGGQIVWRDICFELLDLNPSVFHLIDMCVEYKIGQAYLTMTWFEGKNAWTYLSDILFYALKNESYLTKIRFDIYFDI